MFVTFILVCAVIVFMIAFGKIIDNVSYYYDIDLTGPCISIITFSAMVLIADGQYLGGLYILVFLEYIIYESIVFDYLDV